MNELENANRNNNESDRLAYKKLRNRCNNQLRQVKSKYYLNKLNENELNPKGFWDTLRIFFRQSKSQVYQKPQL